VRLTVTSPKRRHIEAIGSPLEGSDDVVWVWRDVTAQQDVEEQLRHDARHDVLTGLANRALFLDCLDVALVGSGGPIRAACLLLCDLDDFKQVNDTYGHAAGDDVLVQVAAQLLRHTRGIDTVARLGGDEFGIVFSGELPEAEILASRLVETLGQDHGVSDRPRAPRMSIGIATLTAGMPQRTALELADKALYDAKRAGKGQYAVSLTTAS
jgi:diguanylate cyclase (GGDEF)-like protein